MFVSAYWMNVPRQRRSRLALLLSCWPRFFMWNLVLRLKQMYVSNHVCFWYVLRNAADSGFIVRWDKYFVVWSLELFIISMNNPKRVESYPAMMISLYPSLSTSAISIEFAIDCGRELDNDVSMTNGSCAVSIESISPVSMLSKHVWCLFILA